MRKKLALGGIVLFLFCIQFNQVTAQIKKEIKLRGSISEAIENTGKETDPNAIMFTVVNVASTPMVMATDAMAKGIADLPKGLEIAQSAVSKFIANEYRFSLLSSNKYMVNDCLGIKVSTGEFGIKFQDPNVTITSGGDLRIRLKINRITMSGFKLRMRPRVPDFSDPDPCHFSGKFEVGGSARDLSVTILLSPKLIYNMTAAATPMWCLIGYKNEPLLDWTMDALDLAGLANTYYHNAKEMMFDALDFGLNKILLKEFLDHLREQITLQYQACQQAVALTNEMVTFTSGNSQTTLPDGTSNEIKDNRPFDIKPNNLNVSNGRLLFDASSGATFVIYVYRMSDDKYITSGANVNNKGLVNLTPGTYKITINNAPIMNVEIRKGHDTKLKIGVLDVDFDGVWNVYSEDKKNAYTSGAKPEKILLPVGKYYLEEGGSDRIVEVKESAAVVPKKTR